MEKRFFLPLTVLVAVTAVVTLLIGALLGDLSKFMPHSGELLGFYGPQKHLLLFQNNNELRPGGGFISAYGVIDIKNGIPSLNFADSYSLLKDMDYPEAPTPFYVLLDDPNFKGWYFHDGNFNPDFKISAQDTEKLYWRQTSAADNSGDGAADNAGAAESTKAFNSVIAINFEFLEDLVEVYDLEIGGTPLTKENLFSVLEHEVKNIDTHSVEDLGNRKNILGELANKLIKEMLLSPLKYNELFDTINAGLDQKKLILYFKNEDTQKTVEDEGWAGRFQPENYENYIYTSIANIGGRKSDRYVKKTHEYFVVFDGGNGRGKVRYTLSLGHYGMYSLNSDVYKAYVRIFYPAGGYFEEYVEINPEEKKEITIEYFLPEGLNQDNFELDVIKQPGTRDIWELMVQYPTDNSFKAENFDIRDNVGFWYGTLSEDKHFDFELVGDSLPPLVVWQRFIGHNLIEINFSEPLNEAIFLDPSHYEITDLNYIDNYTEIINVNYVYFENSNVYLVTSGVSATEEERYNLSLINLEDTSGNTTNPPILDVTLVKRLEW